MVQKGEKKPFQNRLKIGYNAQMNMPQKILACFLLSAFIFAGIVFFALDGGTVQNPQETLLLVAVFLTLFLAIFFCFNLRRPAAPQPAAPEHDLEELEAADSLPEQKKSNIRLAFGDDDIPYLVESSGLELVDGDLGEMSRYAELEELASVSALEIDGDSGEAAQLEDISTGSGGGFTIFRQPFAFSAGNPELLQEATNPAIYEQDGIHYISSDLDDGAKELDSNFAKLVESVVNKT
ncbi:MAG: hypothetical protein LBI06_03645 [Treponema sp.]|jgi:hypothetical protein|nr:hypothetical protein [Treponema sp.]